VQLEQMRGRVALPGPPGSGTPPPGGGPTSGTGQYL
jgi:hypothetical protein